MSATGGAGWDGYAMAWARLHGGFDPRRASPPVRGWLRMAYGLGRLFGRVRVAPTALTGAALVLNIAVPVAVAPGAGWAIVAGVLVLLGAVADSVDGAVAVLTGRVTRLGYLYASLVQRAAELCWLVAFRVLGAPVWLLVICGAVAWLHEYVRARATVVGLTAPGSMTVAERTMRLSVTVAGLLLAGAVGAVDGSAAAGAVTIAAVVWVFLGVFGLAQLLSGIRKSLATT